MAIENRFVQNDNKNAVCYYRYSSSAQRDVSIEQQKEEAIKFCKAHGYHIIKEYSDRAISGTREDRAGFQQMLYEIDRLKPGYLVVWKGDRLSRDRYVAAMAKKKLMEAGVLIEYVAESMPDNPEDRVLIEGIEEVIAHHFILQHAKNVKRGMRYNAENALYNGRKIWGYTGKVNQRYEIDDINGPLVQRAFLDYANGKPMVQIADELNQAGHRTVRGGLFSEKSLWHTFHNRSYIGEYKWGDIIIPDGFPRLVSDEVFLKVQKMLEKNKHGGRGAARKLHPEDGIEFWLTGHLYCGECGSEMSGTSGTSSTGKVFYYYSCIGHKKKICKKKSIRKERIEAIITDVFNDFLNDMPLKVMVAEYVYEYYQREHAGDACYAKSIQNNIKDIDSKLANIMKAIEAGIFNETTQARMNELQEQRALLADELVVEKNRQQYALKPEHVIKYLESYVGDMNDSSLRAKVLSLLVDKIYLYDDKVVVNCFFSEDAREIRFHEFDEHMANIEKITTMLDGVDENFGTIPKSLEKLMQGLEDGNNWMETDGRNEQNFFG